MKKETLKSLMHFTPWERRGIVTFLVLIALVRLLPSVVAHFEEEPAPLDTSLLEAAFVELEAKLYADSLAQAKKQLPNYSRGRPSKSVGHSTKPTTEPEDSRGVHAPAFPKRTDRSIEVRIDVNTATPEAWLQLPGIGPTFSKRIVKFRDALGGFYAVEQVAETYGLPAETYQAIRPKLHVSGGVKTLSLNKASDAQLAAHPYISKQLAAQIVNYRNKVQPITSDSIFLKLYFMDESQLKKLKPYIEY
ncbi:MAG: helix-hairpin-helix domain-containing protein [Saprospiraceae bacterium]|nr:helix-hairpin-helix domain-containing protein [Saprospiraceae bacterium]